MAATWTRLKGSGDWGVKATVKFNEGETIEVAKRNGGTAKATVGKLLHEGKGADGAFFVFEVKQKKQKGECALCKAEIELTEGLFWTANLGRNHRVNYCTKCVGILPAATAPVVP